MKPRESVRFVSIAAVIGQCAFLAGWSGLSEAIVIPTTPEISFTKVADTDDLIPSTTGNFREFSAPSLAGSSTAFWGGNYYVNGMYKNVGGFTTRVADTFMNPPEVTSSYRFQSFINDPVPSINQAGNVAFANRSSPFNTPKAFGVYTDNGAGGALQVVANKTTAVPGGAGPFQELRTPRYDGNDVTFQGKDTAGNVGIYAFLGGSLNKVADGNTSIPDFFAPGGAPINFDADYTGAIINPFVDGGNVVFRGGGYFLDTSNSTLLQTQGVYHWEGSSGSLTRVVDSFNDGFSGVGVFAVLDGNVAGFTAAAGGVEGVRTSVIGQPGVTQTIADTNTTVPGRSGVMFKGFSSLSLDAGAVAFSGYFFESGVFKQGIYTNLGGSLLEVIAAGEMIDGKTVSIGGNKINFYSEGMSANDIGFHALFDDGSQGIYRATVSTATLDGPPVIDNGGFDNGLFNWNNGGSVSVVPCPPPAGNMCVSMVIASTSFISQDINITPQPFVIEFDYALMNVGDIGAFDVMLDDFLLDSFMTSTSGFVHYSRLVDASDPFFGGNLGPTATLALRWGGEPNGGGSAGINAVPELRIDNIFITAANMGSVPEPSTLLLAGIGLACLWTGRRRTRHPCNNGPRPSRYWLQTESQ